MYIVLLEYLKPLSEVDRFVAEHRAYLKMHYEAGDFLLSGRREPRVGGVIIAQAATRAALETILAGDPFWRESIARYDIVEFVPSMAAPALAHLVAGA